MWQNVKGMLALPEDPNQRAAAKQGLLGFGAALLGGRGDFGGILGDGLMAGSQGYHGALAQQQQGALQKAQQQRLELENRETQAKIDEPMQFAKIMSGFGTSDASAQESGPLSSTPQMSAPGAIGAPSVRGLVQARSAEQQYSEAMDAYRRFTAAGKPAQAKIYFDIAKELRPKLMKRETLLQDGKPVSVMTYEDGTEATSAYGALPSNRVVDMGGTQMVIDENVPRDGTHFTKSATPGERLAAETSRRGQDMADRRAHEANMAPEYKQDTDGTWLALPKKVLAGQPVRAAQVFGPDGKPLAAAPKPLTETQGKATTFAARMTDAEQIINELEADGVSGNDYSTIAAGSPWTNWAASSKGQRYRQAQENWVTANLRQESGAAIPRDEMEKDIRKFFPAVGDGPEVRAQKAQARAVATQGMIVQAGPGARKVDGIVTKARELKDLPKKPAPGGHPADISNLLNKYGAK